uniref:hypothetical protein n=1 Tax=Clostridium sp. MCF-1 TaxID=48257 RepID=UPI0018663582|nr:hypothetical protein [Clostridium sp. MCF-1]
MRQRQEEIQKLVMRFMADYGFYGLAFVTNGKGDYACTAELDKFKVAKWNLDGCT